MSKGYCDGRHTHDDHIVITCDEDWTEHGDGCEMPDEAHTLKEAPRDPGEQAEPIG